MKFEEAIITQQLGYM